MRANNVAPRSELVSAIIAPANSEGLSNYNKNQKESNNLSSNEGTANTVFLSRINKPSNFKNQELDVFVNAVKDGKYNSQIALVRNAKTNADKNKHKSNLPAIAFGRFNGAPSADTYISGSRTITIADIDNIPSGRLEEYRDRLSSHPSVAACFVSPSGNGLKAFFKVPPIRDNAHSYRSWEQINRECKKLASDIVVDPSGKNLSRLCYFSSDKNIYVNFQANELVEDEQYDQGAVGAVSTLSSVKEGELMPIDPAIEDRVIATATGICAKASKDDANRHARRLSLGMYLGGCIAGGLIDEAKATDLAEQLSDSIADNGTTTNKELKTLHDAIAKGQESPIYSLRSDFDNCDDNLREMQEPFALYNIAGNIGVIDMEEFLDIKSNPDSIQKPLSFYRKEYGALVMARRLSENKILERLSTDGFQKNFKLS